MISIKQLVLASYTQGMLDEDRVMQIADALSRNNLKRYIRAIKLQEAQQDVTIEVAAETDESFVHEMEQIFSEKNVTVQVDPTLLLGVRITDNDMVYEASMKHTLDDLITKMSE